MLINAWLERRTKRLARHRLQEAAAPTPRAVAENLPATSDRYSESRRPADATGNALATHVALEDELLYPALRAHPADHNPEIEWQLQQDHLLDTIMVELGGMIPADRRFDAKVRVLIRVFRQHALDSETLLLPELRRRLEPGEREQLSHRLLERLAQLERRRGW